MLSALWSFVLALHIEPGLGLFLHQAIGGKDAFWWYTIARGVLLMIGVITTWAVRRVPWLNIGMVLWCLVVALQVLDDVLTDGANQPYTLYLLAVNLATATLFLFFTIFGELIATCVRPYLVGRYWGLLRRYRGNP